MARHRPSDRLGLNSLQDARADYHMGRRSGPQKRSIRGVPSQGAGADYHYKNESAWLWMGELGWELYRNNMVLGSITDRAIEQQLQGGFGYDPNSGDTKLDEDLLAWWTSVCEDPSECDPSNELTFADQEEIVLRSTLVGGDVFGLPMEDGTVGIREFHLCRSPTRKSKESLVHGVEMAEGTRRRVAYWMLTEPINPDASILKTQLSRIPAYYDDDLTGKPERNCFHVRFPKRSTQTRGITAYAPLFDVAGYHDDVQFLKMVQARAASLFVFVRQRSSEFDPMYEAADRKLGVNVTDRMGMGDSADRQYQEVAAGSDLKSLPGETINPWSANIPNPEFFPHARLLLTFMGINLGMPLVMALMDASETNFSGYRGAIDQARMGFRKNQQRLIRRWHRPYHRFKILKRAERDPVFRRLVERSVNPRTKVDVFKHNWNPPSWPYIEPTKDATADLIRDANMLTSPRRRNRERGHEWTDIYRETVRDRSDAMQAALDEAKVIKDKYKLETPLDVIARQLAPMPMPEGVRISVSGSLDDTPEPAAKPPQPKK